MSSPLQGHRRIDRRSLELHRVIAAKLRAHPALMDIAIRAAGTIADRWRILKSGDTV